MAKGYGRRLKVIKMDISSKGLAREIICNKGGYFVFRVNESKNASIISPKCICEM